MLFDVLIFISGIIFTIIIIVVVGIFSYLSSNKKEGNDNGLILYRDLIRPIIYLSLLFFVCIFIYPTPYYYSYELESHIIVKINRFTGSAYVLNPQTKTWDGEKIKK